MKFRFIDLFAGIGGLRIAFESAGGKCVFSSEYDKFAQLTYEAFFGEKPVFENIKKVIPPGDITQLDPKEIPDHEILIAGFPCQPFSLAGVSKKQSLGRAHGFEDPTQGTLFFNIKEIIKTKRPEAFLLENVKNLQSHDKGRTFKIIIDALVKLDYEITYHVIDAARWTPQHRERIFIIGFRKPTNQNQQKWIIKAENFSWSDLIPEERKQSLNDILEPNVEPKYTLGPGTWNTLKRHKEYHQSKGQGFGYGLISKPFDNVTTRTLSARYHKDGAEILIEQDHNKNPRRLTPLECCRLMGFSKKYQRFFDSKDNEMRQPVSDTQAYRQFGNSVSVPVVTAIAKALNETLKKAKRLR